ncbi:MAG: hypothetical protein AB7D36_00100 [Oscillospiraceae bacterium]
MKSEISRSTLFLTELIFNLLIFVVCAAVCTGLLVRANGLMTKSTQLTEAVYIAQTLAESDVADGEYHFNADGTQTDGNSEYTAVCTPDGDTVIIAVFAGGDEPVYTLRAANPEVGE